MGRIKKRNGFKAFVIVGLLLLAAQSAYIFLFQSSKQQPIEEGIDKAISRMSNLDPRRKEQMRIQLSLNHFAQKNGGKLPESLNKLVPIYFASVPIDPLTKKPFSYKIEQGRYYVGYEEKQDSSKITVLDEKDLEITPEMLQYVYDPAGKRDPFRPFDLSPKTADSSKTPLEQYDIGQLRLTAVLEGFDEIRAIVENQAGKGFTATKGMKIGLNSGEIVEIEKDRMLVLETSYDFTGQKRTRTIEMKLRTKDKAEKESFSSSTRRKR